MTQWRIRLGAVPLLAGLALALPCAAEEPPLLAITPIGPPELVFSAIRDACDGDDVPDAPARAVRTADGEVVVFAMHTLNRALRGADFDHLRIACPPPLRSAGNPDPARYDDASWIAATWTADGRQIDALVHHEFQANTHPGRCRVKDYLACWYNSILAVRSTDGGRSFVRPDPPVVVASAPFRQEAGQGRHRGFFNPSNIVADGRAHYALIATTGWEGQNGGACLFRSENPADAGAWRAYDGAGFTVRYGDPYRSDPKPKPCATLAPFPAPVGGLVRHRGTKAWIAVFQAEAAAGTFPASGFYTTTSADLIHWDAPRLLVAGATLYSDACKAGGRMIAYPALIDRSAEGRNFDTIGDSAELYYATLRVEGCTVTSDRDLVRRRVAIRAVR